MSPSSEPVEAAVRAERRVVLAAALHARPAAAVMKAARAHPDVRVVVSRADGRAAEADALLRLMSLGAVKGTELALRAYAPPATGDDVVTAAVTAVATALTTPPEGD